MLERIIKSPFYLRDVKELGLRPLEPAAGPGEPLLLLARARTAHQIVDQKLQLVLGTKNVQKVCTIASSYN